MKPHYLDYMSTTPIDPRVADTIYKAMIDPSLQASWRNKNYYGQCVAEARKNAIERIAQNINADADGIMFTSGATESVMSCILGVKSAYPYSGNEIISWDTEHSATLSALDIVGKQNVKTHILNVAKSGLIDCEKLKQVITRDTLLVTLSLVNSEIGVIQPIREISQICSENGILLHVDATQAVGKISLSFNHLDIDFMSFSAHKFYGPRGIGVLVSKTSPLRRISPLLTSSTDTYKRAGTESIALIIGLDKALDLAINELDERVASVMGHFNRCVNELKEHVIFHGSLVHRVPHNLNFDTGLSREDLSKFLTTFACSQASACTDTSLMQSHVLRALDIDSSSIDRSVRVSLSHLTTQDTITSVIDFIRDKSTIHK